MDSIKNLYNLYKKHYTETGKREHPERLLALLLLSEKQKFSIMPNSTEGKFYESHRKIIDGAIQQVETDFEFTKKEYAKLITEQLGGFEESNYEEDKIWFCYSEGFGCVHWGIMYHKSEDETTIYRNYFSGESLLLTTLPKITNIRSLDYKEFKFFTKKQDYFEDAKDYINSPIKITLTNIELDTLKECGNLTVLRHGDTPIEITLADKDEVPKQIVKNKGSL